MKLTILLTIIALLTGCQYTNRRAFNQGWLEGYKQHGIYQREKP